MINSIYFRRANKIIVEDYDENSKLNFREVASMDANLRRLGYALSDKAAERLLHAPVDEIKSIHDVLVSEAKEIKGVRRYTPMYPNFPKQVMDASDAELYINAIMHYFGDAVGLRITPAYEKLERPVLDFDESKFTVIGLGSSSDFIGLVKNLIGSNSAFSVTDRNDILSLPNGTFLQALVAAEYDIPNRENKAFIANLYLHLVDNFKFDTATDVLRLAVAMSGGDVSLADNTRFRSFKRRERRLLLSLLNSIEHDIVEDMLRYEQQWKRLGERLHPGDFSFEKVNDAFKVVRENGDFASFNSRVEHLISQGQVQPVVNLLSQRPGEFARRLDKVLRMSGSVTIQRFVVSEFEKVADKASATVLIQALNNFATRDRDIRVFFPKGSVARMQAVVDDRKPIETNAVYSVIHMALVKKFSERESLGTVFIDPALSRVAIPFGLRSASKGNVMGRGTRLPFAADTNILRFFIWWMDGDYRTDIDLSAAIYDADFNYHSSITYYNLREDGAVHSGDITSAPHGASEFIDIDIARLRERGARYVAMTLHSYTGQNFDELPECFAGFMERSDFKSGEIYDPRTVNTKVDLTSKSRGGTPFIFDLETGEAIWVDTTMAINGSYSNVANTKGQITNMVKALTSLNPPTLGLLFELHAIARGDKLTLDKDEADTVFSLDEGITPGNVEVILNEYL